VHNFRTIISTPGFQGFAEVSIDEMLLIACDTDYGWQTWKSNVAGRGILTTAEGDLSISNMRFKTHRGEGD
jgi:hypothetical protein